MTYGIKTKNGMEGFISSEMPSMVVYAKGEATYTTYPSWGFGARPPDNRPSQILMPVTCVKTFPDILHHTVNYGSGSPYNAEIKPQFRMYIGTDSGKTGGDIGYTKYVDNWAHNNVNGRIHSIWSETETHITLWIALPTGSENSWNIPFGSKVTETARVLIFGNLPDNHEQVIPDYGILIKNKVGTNTFNSNYMPFNPATFIVPQGSQSNWLSLPPMSPTGVEGKLLLPTTAAQGITVSHFDSRFFCRVRTIVSEDGKRYGTRIGGWYASPPHNMSPNSFITKGVNRLPVLLASDYF